MVLEDVKDNVIYTVRGKTKVPVPVPIPLHPKLQELKAKIFRCMLDKNDNIASGKRSQKAVENRGMYGVVYGLRHSFVSHLFDLGLSLDDIKVVAGHTKANMTRSYPYPQLERIRETIEKLE